MLNMSLPCSRSFKHFPSQTSNSKPSFSFSCFVFLFTHTTWPLLSVPLFALYILLRASSVFFMYIEPSEPILLTVSSQSSLEPQNSIAELILIFNELPEIFLSWTRNLGLVNHLLVWPCLTKLYCLKPNGNRCQYLIKNAHTHSFKLLCLVHI